MKGCDNKENVKFGLENTKKINKKMLKENNFLIFGYPIKKILKNIKYN